MPSTSTFPSIWAHGYCPSDLTSLELDHQGAQADYQHPLPWHMVTVSLQPTRSPIESTTHHTSQLRPSNLQTRLLSDILVHPSITAKIKPTYTQVHNRVYSTVSSYQLPSRTWLFPNDSTRCFGLSTTNSCPHCFPSSPWQVILNETTFCMLLNPQVASFHSIKDWQSGHWRGDRTPKGWL